MLGGATSTTSMLEDASSLAANSLIKELLSGVITSSLSSPISVVSANPNIATRATGRARIMIRVRISLNMCMNSFRTKRPRMRNQLNNLFITAAKLTKKRHLCIRFYLDRRKSFYSETYNNRKRRSIVFVIFLVTHTFGSSA